MLYKIIHSEALVGWFFYDADSPQDALDQYRHDVDEGKIDFSDMEMIDSSDVVMEADEI